MNKLIIPIFVFVLIFSGIVVSQIAPSTSEKTYKINEIYNFSKYKSDIAKSDANFNTSKHQLMISDSWKCYIVDGLIKNDTGCELEFYFISDPIANIVKLGTLQANESQIPLYTQSVVAQKTKDYIISYIKTYVKNDTYYYEIPS